MLPVLYYIHLRCRHVMSKRRVTVGIGVFVCQRRLLRPPLYLFPATSYLFTRAALLPRTSLQLPRPGNRHHAAIVRIASACEARTGTVVFPRRITIFSASSSLARPRICLRALHSAGGAFLVSTAAARYMHTIRVAYVVCLWAVCCLRRRQGGGGGGGRGRCKRPPGSAAIPRRGKATLCAAAAADAQAEAVEPARADRQIKPTNRALKTLPNERVRRWLPSTPAANGGRCCAASRDKPSCSLARVNDAISISRTWHTGGRRRSGMLAEYCIVLNKHRYMDAGRDGANLLQTGGR